MPAEASAFDTEASALATAAAERQAVAFVSTRSGRAQIYTMNSDGSDPVRLTSEPYDDYYPSWSPDGTRIAFYVHLSWQSWALVVMNADGSGRRQITQGTGCAACAFAPYWSPDGTRIGFTIEPNPRPTCEIKSTELGVINADGTECRWLTANTWNDLFCGWSPDGATILYVSNREGHDQVHRADADLSNEHCLTDGTSTNSMPAWSPDGSRIAFVSNRDGNDEIYTMSADGSDEMRITEHAANDWLPSWSADGTEILFASDRDGTTLDVYAAALDGLTVRRLTAGPGYNYESAWRP
jgi:Tol biopolymer transport system component